MIERVAGGTALGIAAAATATGKPVPEVWHVLGYPFEAAGMIAALFGCLCARFWSGNQLKARKAFRWTLDIPVSAATLAASMGTVIAMRPEPLAALLAGMGIGVVGEGLFKLAQRNVERFDIFGAGPPPPAVSYAAPPAEPPAPDLEDLVRQLNEEPKP